MIVAASKSISNWLVIKSINTITSSELAVIVGTVTVEGLVKEISSIFNYSPILLVTSISVVAKGS